MQLHQLTIQELSRQLSERKVSSRQATEAMFAHIEKHDPDLHGYLELHRETAQAQHAPASAAPCYLAVQPPSTRSDAPVMKLDASEARKTTAGANSAGSPQRPIGTLDTNFRNSSGSSFTG